MLDLAIVVFSLIVAVVLHEIGHASACAFLGFHVQMFAVWPLCLYRTQSSWQLVLSRRFARGPAGFVGAYPVSSNNLRIRTIGIILAGPIFSITVGVICVLLADAWGRKPPGTVPTVLRTIAIWSVLTAINSFLPMVKWGQSDGRHIFELLWGDKRLLRLIAIWSLNGPNTRLRPREWDIGLVSLALDDSIDASVRDSSLEAGLQWLRYNWYADTGRTEQAAMALEWLLSDDAAETDRWYARWETVWFEIFSNNNLAAARDQMRMAEALPKNANSQSMVWKAKAAVAAGEGRHDEAQESAGKAISALAGESRSPGISRAIEDDLDELLGRPSLAAPESRSFF